MPVVFVIIAFAVGGLILARTSYGRIIFAIGGSEESARLMGLPVDRTKVIAYTTSGALAGLAGALLAARLSGRRSQRWPGLGAGRHLGGGCGWHVADRGVPAP